MSCRSNRPWLEHEKYQLWLAHELKVPLKTMGSHFRRTVSSLNKQISRYGIRDKVASGEKEFDRTAKINKLVELENLLINCGLDKETVGLEREQTRVWQPSPFTVTKLQAFGLYLPCPWAKPQKADKLPKRSGIGRADKRRHSQYASFETVMHYLKRHGHDVKPIPKRPPLQHAFQLNGNSLTEFMLLVEANKLRYENEEPIFLVAGVTYED
jgi:hypothetical protein